MAEIELAATIAPSSAGSDISGCERSDSISGASPGPGTDRRRRPERLRVPVRPRRGVLAMTAMSGGQVLLEGVTYDLGTGPPGARLSGLESAGHVGRDSGPDLHRVAVAESWPAASAPGASAPGVRGYFEDCCVVVGHCSHPFPRQTTRSSMAIRLRRIARTLG